MAVGAALALCAADAAAGYKMRPGESRGASSVTQRTQSVCRARVQAFQRALPPVITPVPGPTTPDTPVPAPAAPQDEYGPRITPPEGTPQPGFDQWAVRTFQTSEAAAPAMGQPAKSIRDEYLERIEKSRQGDDGAQDLPYTHTTVWTPAPAASSGGSVASGAAAAADPFAWAQPASGLHNRDQGGPGFVVPAKAGTQELP
ncbi:MAG: hypothetical protein A2X36_13545 [Elusimicrobia bacterium GWA2_69_24]|nr:MAG: hypothetical protein A2X36_13545 [Elusimicrobia bacterium GWA2_69_24]